MNPATPSEPYIIVHEPDGSNEGDGTSSGSQNFSAGFLYAQTTSLHPSPVSPGLEASDRSMNWDDYVVSSATHCPTPVELPSDTIPEMGGQISTVCAHLIKIFRNFGKYKDFLSHRAEAAQDLLDLLQKLLDNAPLEPHFRVILYVALVRLCRKSQLCPRCFSLTDVDVDLVDPLGSGGFGDIYQGQHNGRTVCVKVIRVQPMSDRPALEKAYAREAVVWGQLSHPNILPFYGIYSLNHRNRKLCLVSPWMFNGNIRDFLARMNSDQSQLDRTPLISDVASGMNYLHENGVVHGDLKSLNILVTESERACLADFGLSYVSESSGLGGLSLSSQQAEGGTWGFGAPELIESESKRTSASDVFAFGMVCFEIFTGELPFGKQRGLAIAFKIRKEERPKRSASQVHMRRGLTDTMWALMEKCWSHSPENRPTAAQILQELPPLAINLQDANWDWTRSQRPGFEMFSGQMDATIANALSHLRPLL